MVVGKVKSMNLERLRRIIASHRLTNKIASKVYRRYEAMMGHHLARKMRLNAKRIFKKRGLKREFCSRISHINPREYLDTSHKPNLNLVILVVDCLRHSHLSWQGYYRKTTPFLDSLKSRFTAISAAPWTYPSVASILTGLYPHNHNALFAARGGLRNLKNYRKLRRDVLTLPEMLFLLGYRTYFGSANGIASFSVRGRVVPKGYDIATKADDLLNDLKKWIVKQRGEKFFAYVHLNDLHPPLHPPRSFRNFFGNVRRLPKINTWDFTTVEQQKADPERFQEYKWNRQLLYDNTLRYVDHAIERFHESLEDMGLVDSTVIVVTADHGDEFWEHAELGAMLGHPKTAGHGHSVFREIVEVPLLMSGPLPERKGTGLVSAVDIVPTVLDLLGIRHNMRFDGANIFKTDGERCLLSEGLGVGGLGEKSLVVGRYKLLYSKDDGLEWLFDLENDPGEQKPIVDKAITSNFVEKLLQIPRETEKSKIREIARKKSLSRASEV